MMLENNCQCELCRSIWGAGACKDRDKLTRIEAAIRASFLVPYPSILTLNLAKVEIEALYENN